MLPKYNLERRTFWLNKKYWMDSLEPSTMRQAVCDGGKTDDELVLTPKNLKQHPLIILRGHAERVSIFITRLIRRKQW